MVAILGKDKPCFEVKEANMTISRSAALRGSKTNVARFGAERAKLELHFDTMESLLFVSL